MAYPPCVCGDMPAMHLEKRYLGLVSRTDVELVRPHTYHAKGNDDRSLLRASPSLEMIKTLRVHVDAGCRIVKHDAELREYEIMIQSHDGPFLEWDYADAADGVYVDDIDHPEASFWCRTHNIELDGELNPA